ncbi:hypothetical protein BUALT_Bualt06G0010900 [Buddleja alternifolia]|uniref:RING-type E3 ubiquitin transferase n=1 Tax=Buddleja alternifolia TaxID=168488 RepID=A0AAV6XMI9_9LAMI|nr:hypothetical protein BUALT_Bualt06G0010900 [Buddleja alternifolia]
MSGVARYFHVRRAHLEANDCVYCGYIIPTNLFTNCTSFLCPNPSCRVPHVCLYCPNPDDQFNFDDPNTPQSNYYYYIAYDYDADDDFTLPITTPEVQDFYDYYFSAPPIRTTPALGSFIDSLPIMMRLVPPPTSSSSNTQSSCSICKEDFETADIFVTINEVPCGHCFHKDCIVEWLHRSNTCPLCRYKCPVAAATESMPMSMPRGTSSGLSAIADAATGSDHPPQWRTQSTNSTGEGIDSMVLDEDGDTLMVDSSQPS